MSFYNYRLRPLLKTFHWYNNSKCCYVYLVDVEKEAFNEQFPSSRWFTRGWTLQELIAPTDLKFYDRNWVLLGSKQDLRLQIASITGIDEDTLKGEDISLVSIAKRMSWAATRKTTRVEDTAYCLNGAI
jgi:hypothetical protein